MVTELGNNVEWCFQRLLYTTLILQVGEGGGGEEGCFYKSWNRAKGTVARAVRNWFLLLRDAKEAG